MAAPKNPSEQALTTEPIAGNGLLDRRLFLTQSFILAGAGSLPAVAGDSTAPLTFPEWMTRPGAPLSGYGSPARQESGVVRTTLSTPLSPAIGASSTPLESLQGRITPNGLHFERHHSGIPDIDPAHHALKIHGDVARPLAFSMNDLLRYPMTSGFYFLECSGNGFLNLTEKPIDGTCGALNGLISCSEWTGVKLSVLLEEAGIDPEATWLIAEGADGASLVRSIPLAKAMDDVLIALFQNGERIRPEQGYPMRLFVPGWEGNLSVKWLHRLKVSRQPAQSRSETATYTDLMPDGLAEQFTFTMGVKSVITHPSGKMTLPDPGTYEITGIAWSGHGAIAGVQVSADGGASWADAALDEPVLPKCVCRFRIPWRWSGQPATLMSRAIDDQGNVQPARAAFRERYGQSNMYHFNGVLAWAVAANGRVSNVYA